MTQAQTKGALRLGDVAPDFAAQTTQGPIRFHEWAGDGWVVFFSHPKDFTPVCTTELGEAARRHGEFLKRDAKVLALSVDKLDDHKTWLRDIEETQKVRVAYPIIADERREVAQLYGMIHPNASDTMTVRTVFIIDPAKRVRLTISYQAPTGRNFDEILRALAALQLTDKHSVATPANWKPGQDCVILPSVTDEEARRRFPKGFETLRPYLRVTPQPSGN